MTSTWFSAPYVRPRSNNTSWSSSSVSRWKSRRFGRWEGREIAALRAFRAREAERLFAIGVRIDERTTILTDGFGDPMGSKYLGAMFAAFARERGLDCTYHSLRHTAASLMLASGTDVRTVAGRLGHVSATITLATNSHLIGQANRDAAERLDALLSRSPS